MTKKPSADELLHKVDTEFFQLKINVVILQLASKGLVYTEEDTNHKIFVEAIEMFNDDITNQLLQLSNLLEAK